jgi:hypothetical protein
MPARNVRAGVARSALARFRVRANWAGQDEFMLDQPALDRYPEDRPPPGRPAKPRAGELLVLFLDGSWRSCKVLQWVAQGQGDGELWWVALRWGVLGTLYAGWYAYDPERLLPMYGL